MFSIGKMPFIWFFQILDKCLNHWTIASSPCYAFRKVLAITLNAMTPKENKSSVPWGLKHVFWYFRYSAWDIWPHTENNELKSEDEMDCGMIVFVVVLVLFVVLFCFLSKSFETLCHMMLLVQSLHRFREIWINPYKKNKSIKSC